MGEWIRRAFRPLIRALCPPPPAPQFPDLVDRIELQVRRFMSYMHPLAAGALVVAILLLDWAPRLLLQSVRRLQAFERERASRLLTVLSRSRWALVRTMIAGVRGAVLSAYFDQEEVHRALGYAPVPFLRDRLDERRRLVGAPNPDAAE